MYKLLSAVLSLLIIELFAVEVHAQCVDSLIVISPLPVDIEEDFHLPLYARVCEENGQGMTSLEIMVQFDSLGLDVYSIEWNGTSLGEAPTAIEEYIGVPEIWAMENAGANYRGGTSLFTLSSTPHIPGGHHLLCFLVSHSSQAGSYPVGPTDGPGDPPLENVFAFMLTEHRPVLVGCKVDVFPSMLSIKFNPPPPWFLAEGSFLSVMVEGAGPCPDSLLRLSAAGVPDFVAWTQPPDASSPVVGQLDINPQACDYDYGPLYPIDFTLECLGSPESYTATETVTVVDTPVQPSISAAPCPHPIAYAGGIVNILIIATQADAACDDITLTTDDPIHFVDHGNGTGLYQWETEEADVGEYTVCFWAEDGHGYRDSICCDLQIHPPAAFKFKIKKIEAFRGQQHICVPVFLDNGSDVGAFEVLVQYDPTGATIIAVDPFCCDQDSFRAHDPEESRWHWYHRDDADWENDDWAFHRGIFEPEYFNYALGAGGHDNWVRVVGIMDLAWPQDVVPPIPPGVQKLLFCLIVDVSAAIEGHEVFFNFRVTDCTDNSISDPSGDILWSPLELPPGMFCPNPAVELVHGPGLAIVEVARGDINCDSIPYSVADAMMFLNYLIFGEEALQDTSGDFYCSSFAVHLEASDIDGDGYGFTIADLVKLIRIINGYELPPLKEIAGIAELTLVGNEMVLDTPAEIGGLLVAFDGEVTPTLGEEVRNMEMIYAVEERETKVLIYSLREDGTIPAGRRNLLTIHGLGRPIDVKLTDFYGNPIEAAIKPAAFRLAQNYPNPFNPETEISYFLPEDCHVTVEIFNLLGQRVDTIVDEQQPSGTQSIRWNAGSLASGIYLYRINAGAFRAVRRMILLK